jgi:dGTPase
MTAPSDKSMTKAGYAVAEEASRGRLHAEEDSGQLSLFEFDRDRILSCTAFRRLMHKTQVFVTDRGDHFRTRLTHTLEVAAQARRLARMIRLNHRLAEAIALAHDLGHSPFGHAGEKALAEMMADHGGFEHNRQSLRVVDYLEHPYPAFRGLNLSFELRESLIKHSTPYDRPLRKEDDHRDVKPLFDVGPMPPLEGQVASLADLIAYTLHDIEDGLGEEILTQAVLDASSLWREVSGPVRRTFPEQNIHAVRRPILDRLADRLCQDAAAESGHRLRAAGIIDVEAVRHHPTELIAFSGSTLAAVEELQNLLLHSLYRDHRIAGMDFRAGRLVRDLFGAYLAEPRLLPTRFSHRVEQQGPHCVVCDYIAGMTDRFCEQEHRRLFGSSRLA